MNFPAAVLLGIIQGLTEFLPVSSSAHLILARAFFGWEMPPEFGLAFDVAAHVGTLAAILVFFRVEIFGMVRSLPGLFSANPEPSAKLARLIVVGTIPVVIVALAFNDLIEQVFRTPAVAAGALAFGAVLMLAAERVRTLLDVEAERERLHRDPVAYEHEPVGLLHDLGRRDVGVVARVAAIVDEHAPHLLG